MRVGMIAALLLIATPTACPPRPRRLRHAVTATDTDHPGIPLDRRPNGR